MYVKFFACPHTKSSINVRCGYYVSKTLYTTFSLAIIYYAIGFFKSSDVMSRKSVVEDPILIAFTVRNLVTQNSCFLYEYIWPPLKMENE